MQLTFALLQVCRSAGYFEHALYVAYTAEQFLVCLDILIEDRQAWDEALDHLDTLSRPQRAEALQKFGKVIVHTISPFSRAYKNSFLTYICQEFIVRYGILMV